jgi:hypothetical protein
MLIGRLVRYGYQVTVPTIDIANYLGRRGEWEKDCREMAECFVKYGLVTVKDPRVDA